VVSTLAGLPGILGSADGTGSAARFTNPNGVAVDSAGNVYVADTTNDTIRNITPGRVVSTLAGLARSSGSADGTGSTARFSSPRGVAVDSAGNVYVADTANNTIRVGTPAFENCTICHKGVQTLTLPCGSLEYRRHKDHGDTDGPCTGTSRLSQRR
jgi:sugar lactone lactonase YvrE